MIKALLFDFNGVIINDEPIHMAAYREVLKPEGIDLTEEKYLQCLGMNDRAFLSAIFEVYEKELPTNKVDSILEAKTAEWKKIVSEGIPLFDGVSDMIHRMESEFTLGLVSMARRAEVEFVLNETGLNKAFSAVITSSDLSTYKPNPECYKLGFKDVDAARTRAGKAALTHGQCVAIEDSPPGVQSALGAGLHVLGFAGTVSREKLLNAGAEVVTENLADWHPDSFKRVFV
ncbi:MAG: HAD family hydrolase [Pyrinomonadaceae bacterium]